MKLKFSLLFLTIFFCQSALACRVSTPGSINFATSIEENKSFSYQLNQISEELPISTIQQCQTSVSQKKYLMIAYGPEVVELSDQMRGYNFNGAFINSKCEIKNNPLKFIQSNEQKKIEFEKKWEYIKKCIFVKIKELGSHDLAFPLDQEGCHVQRINNKTALFSGGYCFFKPSSDSQFKVSLGISSQCEKLDDLNKQSVELRDLRGELSFYLSSQYKGELVDLDAIATSDVRHSTNPIKTLIQPSDDFGLTRPLFPAAYVVNDLHLGKIEFVNVLNNYFKIKTPFIVDHQCEKITREGIQSSACNYDIPLTADITLKNERGEEILHWVDGGIVPAQWQGIINGSGKLVAADLLKPEGHYLLEVQFNDPYFDYLNFKKSAAEKISQIPHLEIAHNPDGTIKDIFELPSLGELEQGHTIEILSPNESVEGVRKRLNALFSSTMFPPLYEKICIGLKDQCQKNQEDFVKFKVKFFLSKENNLMIQEIIRQSKLLGDYHIQKPSQPEFQCH